jgi:hypothetical protein
VNSPYKYGGYIPVSRELLDDSDYLRRAMHGELTEREKAEARAERERRASERATVVVEHQGRLDAATGLRRAVLDLHAPVQSAYWLTCEGCDIAGHEAEPPEWPCRTYSLAAQLRDGETT